MSGVPVVEIIQRPCGAGKTREAARLAAIHSMANRAVFYVAPTLALLEQFRNFLIEEGVDPKKIRFAVGKRLGFNCQNPEIFVLPAFGHGQEKFCEEVCPHRSVCLYWGARMMIESANFVPGFVVLSTYSFLMHLRGKIFKSFLRLPAVVIYDEMPAYPLDIFDEVEDVDISMSVVAEEILESKRGATDREKVIGKWGVLRLVPGEETYFLSATPSLSIIRLMFPGCDVRLVERGLALDQEIEWRYLILSHSKPWIPEVGGCGFKRNTYPGFPYFRASVGLGQWRGKPLRVFGSFSPPWENYAILAAMVGGRLRFSDVIVELDASVQHPIAGGEFRAHWDGVLAIENGEGIFPIPYEIVFSDIAQLLGRSGIGVRNAYFGSIPLRARNHAFEINGVRRLEMVGWDEHDLAIAALRHAIGATTRNGNIYVLEVLRFLDAIFPNIYSFFPTSEIAKIVKRYKDILSGLNKFARQLRVSRAQNSNALALEGENGSSYQEGVEEGYETDIPF